ncbi:response regulator [Mycolicibacterium neoaurum]|uniref:Response regulator containing a CheY-like receiver domain and an HTH DNA-binding domain protein n=1 Tax=Mycolicibacterium neoaurum TaxID=1795 RepID=A0AAV2WHJ3_MYCNE|nr:response regulator transcription factor [Mycolicibacterium neoaurum]TLH60420.1 DNA-binding response regulator [Mycolicibacterium neoaurum]CDQ43706.1 response regulator containing a CheY-like receiver domain and an HTH DNA-binding domain protein [Mycolicibacterium neoaurum]
MVTRVVIADDQRLVRAGLRMLCDSTEDIEVVAEASDGAQAVRSTAELMPDVVLMDLRMPGVDGITATEQIRSARADSKILVLTTFDDDEHLYPALAAGASGFLVKDTEPSELLTAVRRVAAGELVLSAHVLQRLVLRAVDTRGTAGEPVQLTEREEDVLPLVIEGLSNQEIAARLHLGVTTVKTHVANLMTKLGAQNRVQLAVYGYQRMA